MRTVKNAVRRGLRALGYDIVRAEKSDGAAQSPSVSPVMPELPPHLSAWWLDHVAERNRIVSGAEAIRVGRRLKHVRALSDVEVGITSQFGEDGILDWLIEHAQISAPRFVEIGVGNYSECNTRFLVKNRNWRGLAIEGDAAALATVRQDPVYWLHDLTALAAFVTAENAVELIEGAGFGGPMGLLSLDIDGNDYWVMKELRRLRPDIIVCEYNAVLGDLHAITIPYDPAFSRLEIPGTSRLYYGASIAAFVSLLDEYVLVGSNTAGNNAFFVRSDLRACMDVTIEDTAPRPSLFRESYDDHGNLTFIGGTDRLDVISHMPVVDLRSGETVRIGDLGAMYSDRWMHLMGRGPIA